MAAPEAASDRRREATRCKKPAGVPSGNGIEHASHRSFGEHHASGVGIGELTATSRSTYHGSETSHRNAMMQLASLFVCTDNQAARHPFEQLNLLSAILRVRQRLSERVRQFEPQLQRLRHRRWRAEFGLAKRSPGYGVFLFLSIPCSRFAHMHFASLA